MKVTQNIINRFNEGETFFFRTKKEQLTFVAAIWDKVDMRPVVKAYDEVFGWGVVSCDQAYSDLFNRLAYKLGEGGEDLLKQLLGLRELANY